MATKDGTNVNPNQLLFRKWHFNSSNQPFTTSDLFKLPFVVSYRMMLRTLTTLEAQRKQAVQDLDILVDKKKDALQDPLHFAQRLQQQVRVLSIQVKLCKVNPCNYVVH